MAIEKSEMTARIVIDATVLAIVVAIVLVMLLMSTQAWACRCRGPSLTKEGLMDNDRVFSGHVIAIEEPPVRIGGVWNGELQEMWSGGDPITYTFRVESVWAGPVAEELEVQSASSGASCGRSFRKGVRYVVFANEDDQATLWTSSCSAGSQEPALAERYVLGAPEWSRGPVEPIPTLEQLSALLTSPDDELKNAAVDFWLQSDCGLYYLARRAEELDLDDDTRDRLDWRADHYSRLYSHFEIDSTIGSASIPLFPPTEPHYDWQVRVCDAGEREWVADELGESRLVTN